MIPHEFLEVLGVVTAAAGSSFIGGKNSLNGFKNEVRAAFLDAKEERQEAKVDISEIKLDIRALRDEDTRQDVRIKKLETPPLDTHAEMGVD